MEIRELWLKHYGRFEDHRIMLKPGINIIYGGNEAGKTTIHSFIKAMFYGVSRARGKASQKDEYQVRQPWNYQGVFDGSMWIEHEGEIYRIDRNFNQNGRPLLVTNETLAKEYDDPQEILNQILGKTSEAAFLNTVFMSQAHAETDEHLALELQNFMVNCENSLDKKLDVNQALQTLRKKKKELEKEKKKGEDEVSVKIRQAEQMLEEKRRRLEQTRRESEQRMQQERKTREPVMKKTGRPGRTVLEVILLLAAVAAGVLGLLSVGTPPGVYFGVFCLLFLIAIVPVHFLLTDTIETFPDPVEKPSPELERLQAECAKLEQVLEKLYDQGEESADVELEALNIAIERINALSSNIYERSGSRLNEYASSILDEITSGDYNRIVMDENMNVRIHTAHSVLGLHQVSGGTLQQIYFALRMAASDLMSLEILPVILDETFALYDDVRLEQTLRWLKKSDRQVILFTCHAREREILQRI